MNIFHKIMNDKHKYALIPNLSADFAGYCQQLQD